MIRLDADSPAKIDLRIGALHHVVKIEQASDKALLNVEFAPNPKLESEKEDSEIYLLDNFLSKTHAFAPYIQSEEYNAYAAGRNAISSLDKLYNSGKIEGIHYLPADRGGIMHAHATVVSALIESAPDAGLYTERTLPVLSGVLSDFMRILARLANMGESDRSKLHNLETGRTKNVLSGTMDVERLNIGYPRFVYRPEGREESISLVNVSSMVSELGPLALFLQHYVSPGDLLVLEEPEAHLHPELQRKLTVELVKLVKKGVRIVLTTHSDWVLSELSNVVALGIVHPEGVDEPDAPSLDREDIGVWRYGRAAGNGAGSGSKISEVEWEPNGGGYEAGFYDVLVTQNNNWARIMDDFDWSGEQE